MTMGNMPSQQLALFGQAILLGISMGVLYDLLRPFRLKLPRLTTVWDIVYCLAVGAVFLTFVLERGAGELRGFMMLGAAGGMVLFFCVFSAILTPVWDFWADTLSFLVYLLAVFR